MPEPLVFSTRAYDSIRRAFESREIEKYYWAVCRQSPKMSKGVIRKPILEYDGKAPGDPRILDTLGWLLVRRGDFDAGLKHLREARVRDPRNPEIRFHLASALALGGRNVEARQELTLLLADSPSFPGAGDARALLKELGG